MCRQEAKKSGKNNRDSGRKGRDAFWSEATGVLFEGRIPSQAPNLTFNGAKESVRCRTRSMASCEERGFEESVPLGAIKFG